MRTFLALLDWFVLVASLLIEKQDYLSARI